MVERRGAYIVLMGKRKGKGSLGRLIGRWVDNIKMDLQKWDVGVWTGFIWLSTGTGGGHL
jgi:hypothetical protein